MNFKTLENLIKKEKDRCAEVAITSHTALPELTGSVPRCMALPCRIGPGHDLLDAASTQYVRNEARARSLSLLLSN